MSHPLKVIIIGAGIGGLTAAVVLRQLGHIVEVYEQAPGLRTAGSGLSVMSNALAALSSIGVNLKLEQFGAPVKYFEIRNANNRLLRRMPVPEIAASIGFNSVCISRKALQEALLGQLDKNIIHVGAKITQIIENNDSNDVTVRFANGRETRGDILIGADGIYSFVRDYIQGSQPVRPANYICWLAITRYNHSQITPGYVCHYWGTGKRVGLVDIGGGELYWWGTANMPTEQARRWRGSNRDVLAYYKDWPTLVTDVIAKTPTKNIITVPAQDRPFSPLWGKGKITLLGDAAHPMLASLGQGAGMAIEDAAVLGHVLKRSRLKQAGDPVEALRQYEKNRIPRAEMLVNASKMLSDAEQDEGFFNCLTRDLSLKFLPINKTNLGRYYEKSIIFPTENLI
ncbi:MAG: FAD-dependent monooxygenase [Enterobacteriaceae bacterium]|jgi:2-polyprenyl-6-methoxyphenol hydroxylase-like FAD-dependent oxidoreductase|nr:FAD-dependent monooxygenase [Enterobacteriaceae bacterium]